MSKIKSLLAIIDLITEWAGRVTLITLVAMMLAVTYEVVSRYIFNAPTLWAFDITRYLLCGCTALGGAYGYLHASHVNMNALHARLSTRKAATLDLVTSLLAFMFLFLLISSSLKLAISSLRLNEHAMSAFAPIMWPVKLSVTIGALLFFLAGISRFIKTIIAAITGEAQEKEEMLFGSKERK